MPVIRSFGYISLLNVFENISIKNLKENGGTLGLTFYQMLSILNKHHQIASVEYIHNTNGDIAGYALIHLSERGSGIHISHIAIVPNDQKCGLGTRLVSKLMKEYDYISADVMFDNYKSQGFFRKLGFDFIPEVEKNRWNVEWKR